MTIPLLICGVDGTRTHYLLIANQMLYQMSYYPLSLKKVSLETFMWSI